MRTRIHATPPFVFFARNLARLLVPGAVLLAWRRHALESLPPDQLALALSRARYACRLHDRFELPPDAGPWSWSLFERQRNYAFDLVEHLRWFDPASRVAWRFGDETAVPAAPTLVKARPIEGDVANAVLFPLNTVRHFRFVSDGRRFAQKLDRAVWRGKAFQPHRLALLDALQRDPLFDVGCTAAEDPDPRARPRLSIRAQLACKFVVSIEGNDVATNLKWILSSNSVCVMPRPRFETWFQEGLLEPGVHYLEIAPDGSDAGEKVRELARRPDLAERITRAANAHCARFRRPRIERAAALLVLERYLALSGQSTSRADARVSAAANVSLAIGADRR